jgi:hypothetical protein
MKTKLTKIFGVAFALVLVASMLVFAIPASAGAYQNLAPALPNTWQGFPPQPSALGSWFFDPAITQVGPVAEAINGDIYAYVAGTAATPNNPGTNDIFKSTDGGRTWTVSTVPFYFVNTAATPAGASTVIDIVCSSQSEDVVYVTDGNYVYKSVNGGLTFAIVAEDSLETILTGTCGPAVVLTSGAYITCLDVGYNASGDSYVFIGVNGTFVGGIYDINYASVLYISEAGYPSQWVDLQLKCFHANIAVHPYGGYTPYSVGVSPDFATSKKIYVAVSTPDDFIVDPAVDAHTWVIRSVGITCSWDEVDQLLWNCDPANNFRISHASRFAFPTDYATLGTMFIGVVAWNGSTTNVPGGDVYAAFDTTPQTPNALDLNVQGYTTGCIGLYHANICSLDIDENDALLAGAWDSYQLQSPVRTYYSADGGWTWTPSLKDPSGTDRTYVLLSSFGAVAGTRGCDCAFSMSCGEVVGAYWNQISLISMNIDAVLDMSHAPGYLDGSSIMYALTTDATDCFACGTDSFTLTATVATTPASATVIETAADDHVVVTKLVDPDNDVTITYVAATRTWTITFPDTLDSVLVTATADVTNVKWTQVDATVAALEYYDCDSDMTVAASGVTFNMPDGIGAGPDINSLLKWDGTYWQRVHDTRYYNALGQAFVNGPLYVWVEVSPDFNDTECLYMANTAFQMTRSTDQGCSWRVLPYPCAPLPTISAWIVVDEETVLASGSLTTAAEWVYKTTRHGTRPWSAVPVLTAPTSAQSNADGVDFDLSPSIATDNNVLLSDEAGQVFISKDLATTPFNEITDVVNFASFRENAGNTYCVFDPGYGTADDPGENMIYAAAVNNVGRCSLNSAAALSMQDWVYINVTGVTSCDPFAMVTASGIAVAGDTALYVSDTGALGSGATATTTTGTVMIECVDCTIGGCGGDFTFTTQTVTVTGTTAFIAGELVEIVSSNIVCTTTCTSGEPDTCTFTITGEIDIRGLSSGAVGYITFTAKAPTTTSCTSCSCTTTTTCTSNGVVLSGHLAIATTTAVAAHLTGVWRTLNPMDPVFPYFSVDLIEWEFLQAGTAGPSKLIHPQADLMGVYPDDLWITKASNMLWALDDIIMHSPSSSIWMWEDPLATPVVLISPADGAVLATSTSVTISWDPLDGATLYEYYIYSFCPTCPANMLLFRNTTTNLTCIVVDGLIPGTEYFWKVRVACDSPQVSKWSELRSFDTALSSILNLCSPICGSSDIVPTTNYSWDAVLGATGYELQVVAASADGTVDWTGATSYNSTTNAFASIPGLQYSTVYYWRVRAVSDGVYSAWSECIFTTKAEPVAPVEPGPPVVVEQNEITPTWIWVIIGIGGALTIAVVILIVTTRRVP